MLPKWSLVVEWAVANRQNHLEWVLLAAKEWAGYAFSPARQQKLKTLTSVCDGFGIACVGCDCFGRMVVLTLSVLR